MKAHRYNFLFVVGLLLTLGLTTAFAHGDDNKKRLKHDGILSVKTSPGALPVRIDGQDRGPSGVGYGREFYLAPGFHTVEVLGPDGKIWKQEIEIHRGERNCICLKVVQTTLTRECPYRFHLEGPDRVTEGDLVTFVAVPDVQSPIPLRYDWRLSNGIITSGMGKPSITVDSKGLGGRTINAELDVNDDKYDGRCRQTISVPTDVVSRVIERRPEAFRCDEFLTANHDKDKARFDNCVIQVQNVPDAQMYVIIYPGTDRMSLSKNSYEQTSKFYLDYLVKSRKVNPGLIRFVRGGSVQKTTVVIWVVPPGAKPPVP